jgi:glycosyltransferase involved in cell wall biosynthesis
VNIKHIYWFSYFDLSEPGIRYRGKYLLEELKQEHNISYDIVYTGYRPNTIIHFLRVYFSILFFRQKNSLVVFQKIRTNRIYSRVLMLLLRFRNKATIYDIDDPDYIKFSKVVMHKFMKHSSACFAGSDALLQYCGEYNKNVMLLSSPVIKHGYIKEKRNDVLNIGWIGYYNAHKQSLHELLFPAVLKAERPVMLTLLGVVKAEYIASIEKYFSGNGNVTVNIPRDIDWQNEDAVYKMICRFDIGVSPLLDTEVNRAKSAFKLKQYLSCGIPVLASPVGENQRFLKDGYNGYSCMSASEFYEAINKVQNLNAAYFEMLQRNARLSFEDFSMKRYAKDFITKANSLGNNIS